MFPILRGNIIVMIFYKTQQIFKHIQLKWPERWLLMYVKKYGKSYYVLQLGLCYQQNDTIEIEVVWENEARCDTMGPKQD